MKLNFFNSLKQRGFDTICLLNGNDADIFDFIQNFPHGATGIHTLSLRCCNLTDRGLEALMEFLQSLYSLEINGCNEVTEQGLWSSLHPRLISLTVTDCINVADECICAITQLLPALYEFNLQAYHVTDSALSYFSPKQTGTMSVLRLQSCWEVTNHGLVNIVHSLPNLTILSLSGCSKITDDGIELIAENLRKLVSLDVSWCPRITDAALEYIACDLTHLEELTLDRCVHISDIGVGYISTMLALASLFLRWCSQIRDFGLQHICGMRNLKILSVAGCTQLTSSGLSNLIQLLKKGRPVHLLRGQCRGYCEQQGRDEGFRNHRPCGQRVRGPVAQDRFERELHLLRAATTELSSSTCSAARTTQDDPLTSSFKFNLTKNHKIKDNKVGLSQHNREKKK